MRKLYGYFKTHWKEEVKLPYLLVIMGFLALSIFVEYNYHVASKSMNPYRNTLNHFFAYFIFYSIPVLFSILTYISFYKRKDLFSNTRFWIVLLYIISAYAFRGYFYQHREWITVMNNGAADSFLIRCSSQVFKALLIFFLVFVFWKFSGHSKETAFYGFKLKGVDIKPYFLLLLMMVPLIALASTQHDFLHKYPTFASFVKGSISSPVAIAKIGIYEILYGSDYVAIELFFRGFVLYALSRFLGKGAIIPMATMYVFIHFGKPAGETISSFFGGMILGVIAYETNSIIGGIIVHCGIAYMMEIGGFIGNSI
jgi:hypothetical protein